MRRREALPENCSNWAGALGYAQSLISAKEVERQAEGTTRERTPLDSAVESLLAVAIYNGALRHKTRREALQDVLNFDSGSIAVVVEADWLAATGQISAPEPKAAIASLKAFSQHGHKAIGTICTTAYTIVIAAPDAGWREETEPLRVRVPTADGGVQSKIVSICDAVRFDRDGLTPREVTGGNATWVTPTQEFIHLWHIKPGTSIIPAEVKSLIDLRKAERGDFGPDSGLVALDVVGVDGIPAILSITRTLTKTEGMAYAALLTIPFEEVAICIRIGAREVVGDSRSITGVREATVMAIAGDAVRPRPDGSMEGWTPFLGEELDTNLSETQDKDVAFPAHPLSRVRRAMDALRGSLQLDATVFGTCTPIRLPVKPDPGPLQHGQTLRFTASQIFVNIPSPQSDEIVWQRWVKISNGPTREVIARINDEFIRPDTLATLIGTARLWGTLPTHDSANDAVLQLMEQNGLAVAYGIVWLVATWAKCIQLVTEKPAKEVLTTLSYKGPWVDTSDHAVAKALINVRQGALMMLSGSVAEQLRFESDISSDLISARTVVRCGLAILDAFDQGFRNLGIDMWNELLGVVCAAMEPPELLKHTQENVSRDATNIIASQGHDSFSQNCESWSGAVGYGRSLLDGMGWDLVTEMSQLNLTNLPYKSPDPIANVDLDLLRRCVVDIIAFGAHIGRLKGWTRRAASQRIYTLTDKNFREPQPQIIVDAMEMVEQNGLGAEAFDELRFLGKVSKDHRQSYFMNSVNLASAVVSRSRESSG